MGTLEIIVDGVRLTGAIAKVAHAAAAKHFADAGVAPYQAALAAFIQESEEEPVTKEQGDWAEVWRSADEAVAKSLGIDSHGVSVNLTDEARRANDDPDRN